MDDRPKSRGKKKFEGAIQREKCFGKGTKVA